MKDNKNNEIKYRAYKFSIIVVKFVAEFPKSQTYWMIADQLLRAATSIGANIIEAQAASSRRDFIKFYQIALKSAVETKYWLGILRDATEADKNKVKILLDEANQLSKILGASLLTLKGKRKF